jgi:hypothetical protein
MNNVITLFLVLTVVGMLPVLLFLWQLHSAWPKSNEEVFRQRLQLPPRRRLLPRLRLPQFRLSRRPKPLTLPEAEEPQQEEAKKARVLAQRGEETSVASRLSVPERRSLHQLSSSAGPPTTDPSTTASPSGAGRATTAATIPPSSPSARDDMPTGRVWPD